jgi:hypothetical protein
MKKYFFPSIGFLIVFIITCSPTTLIRTVFTSPTVQITSPDPLGIYNGTLQVTVQANATEDNQVTEIHYSISSSLDLTTDTLTAPADFTPAREVTVPIDIDTTLFTSENVQTVTILLYCVTSDGQTSAQTAATFQADNNGPVVSITSPAQGSTISGNSNLIEGSATDWSGVKSALHQLLR